MPPTSPRSFLVRPLPRIFSIILVDFNSKSFNGVLVSNNLATTPFVSCLNQLLEPKIVTVPPPDLLLMFNVLIAKKAISKAY